MFVYRDLLRGVLPLHNSAEALFNAVAVFYATMFRTTAALKYLDSVQASWLPNDAQSRELAGAFSYALSLRDTFCESLVYSTPSESKTNMSTRSKHRRRSSCR